MELTERLKGLRSFCAEACRQTLEPALYAVGIGIYSAGVGCAALRLPKARLLARGQKEVWRRLADRLDPEARYVWIHAASLGEFEQGRPLIERIRRERPEYKILLTFFSPSGYEVRKDYAGADCVCYLPFDTPGRVKRFLETVKPEKAIFVKYEIWRNYLHELYERGIPTYLISAAFRPDQRFFRHRGSWYGMWLRWYRRIFVQDERSRELLESIHIHNAEVCGDTRFDRVTQIKAMQKEIDELQAFTHRGKPGAPAVMMAGSSWPADEDIYAGWFDNHPETKLVIAPHEFDTQRLDALKARFANGTVLLSEMRRDPRAAEGKQVMVIDCFGLLSSAYAYCDAAYVGGGFGAGLHNINEAAVYDIPVIYGPNNRKFIEARELAACGGGVQVSSREEFANAAGILLLSEEERRRRGSLAGRYIRSKTGATDRIYTALGFDRNQHDNTLKPQ